MVDKHSHEQNLKGRVIKMNLFKIPQKRINCKFCVQEFVIKSSYIEIASYPSYSCLHLYHKWVSQCVNYTLELTIIHKMYY